MTHPNKKKGNNYENRFITRMKKLGAKSAIRHYGSIGITDVEWTDQNGKKHEAQLKFSSRGTPRISKKEMNSLYDYAQKLKGKVKVWLVKKQSYKKEEWFLLN